MSSRLEGFVEQNDIYLFGAPGVGKTTFVNSLREDGIFPRYISIGEVTNQRIDEGDRQLLAKIESALPFDLETVRSLIEEEIKKPSSFLLDGVPRKTDEAFWIAEEMLSREVGQTAVLLTADDRVVADRLASRDEANKISRILLARKQQFEANFSEVFGIINKNLSLFLTIQTDEMTPQEVIKQLEEGI
jgi:adenylate kinase family enzyme